MDYQHHTNFYLTYPRTGEKMSLFDNFGGIIINTNETTYDRECMPQVNLITDKNDNRDGEIYINSTYGIRTIEVSCFFSEENGGGDLTLLKKWLHKQHDKKKELQLFEWDDDDEEKGIYVIPQGFNSQVYYQKRFYGQIDLKFIAPDPYWFINKKEEVKFENLVIGDYKTVGYRGNTESFPLIKVIPNTTTLVFKWNDLTVTLNNMVIAREYYIDCELESFYYIQNGIKIVDINNIVTTKYRQFPLIDADLTNKIMIITGSASFYINPRTRII